MNFRVVMVAIVTAAGAAAAVAQPDKDEQPIKGPEPVAAPVVLASAGDPRGLSSPDTDRASKTARRPAPRVTTCRCGDPQPNETQQPEE